MRTKGTIVVVAVLATLALTLSASIASALRSIETGFEGESSEFRSSGTLTFTEAEGTFRVVCSVIKVLGIGRAIPKTIGAVFGHVHSIRVAVCTGGTLRVLTTNLPWPIRYVSFTGTLPNIREVRLKIEGMEFLLEVFFGLGRCLYQGGPQMVTRGNPIREDARDSTVAIPLLVNLGGTACPASVIEMGTLVWNPTVRLILI